jgi:biotin operon repressor
MIEKLNSLERNRNFEFWTFLEKAYEKNLKLDLGHFKLLSVLLNVNEIYNELSDELGKKDARKMLEKEGIFTKNSEYVSGEYLKKYIERDSRVAVHNRINDLRKLDFIIETKPGPLGGYKLLKTPEWFENLEASM